MRQKTKTIKIRSELIKNDFLFESLIHLPRLVHLVQKTRAKNSHAWAPLKGPKREIFGYGFFM